jgi:hypothetical protein
LAQEGWGNLNEATINLLGSIPERGNTFLVARRLKGHLTPDVRPGPRPFAINPLSTAVSIGRDTHTAAGAQRWWTQNIGCVVMRRATFASELANLDRSI